MTPYYQDDYVTLYCGKRESVLTELPDNSVDSIVTPPNGTVLDLFAGSGTTLQAAKQLGFHAIGIEQEQWYCDDCMRRCVQGVMF